MKVYKKQWSRDGESNPGPTVYETVALPAELSRLYGHPSLDLWDMTLRINRPLRLYR